MTIEPTNPFAIENEAEADEYLSDLFQNPAYRSMDEALMRAHKFVSNERVRAYLIERARQLLKT